MLTWIVIKKMKKNTNNSASPQQSPIKRQKTSPRAFVTPPRDSAKAESALSKQLWSVGARTTAASVSNTVHITRNRNFELPGTEHEVLAATFAAKYKTLKEINDEVGTLREQLKNLAVVTKAKEKTSASKNNPLAEKRKKIAKINSTLENIFIRLLPNIKPGEEIDDILRMIIAQLKSDEGANIINTLVTAINKSYENSSNTQEQKAASFSNRLRIITFLNSAKLEPNEHKLWSKLHGYKEIVLQLNFEQQLENLEMYFTPLNKLRHGSTKRTRIVFTDLKTSIDGFKYMQDWIAFNADGFDDIKNSLKQAGVQKINAASSRPQDLDLEIAWLHLMNDGRHLEENLVFVGDIQSLEFAVKFCTRDTTLVLNAHGGQNEFTINKMTSDGYKKSTLMGPSLISYMNAIVEVLNEKITHFILLTCATGNISYNPNLTSMDKYTIADNNTDDLRHQKNRKKIFIDETSPHSNLESVLNSFGKLSIGSNSVAATLAKLLFERAKQDTTLGTAFTFSPTIIHPGIAPHGGVIAAPKGLGENRRNWPEYNTDWKIDSSELPLNVVAYKSYTLYNNPQNRKALGFAGIWKDKPRTRSIKWAHQPNFDNTHIFSALNPVLFELIKNKIVNDDNSFVATYKQSLIAPGVKFQDSGGTAIMQAFIKSIRDQDSSLDTTFDLDVLALSDILYIVHKLGCFTQVYEHHDNPTSVKVHILSDNPAGLTLHVRQINARLWQIAALDIDKQNAIATQQRRPDTANMSWPHTSYTHHKRNIIASGAQEVGAPRFRPIS